MPKAPAVLCVHVTDVPATPLPAVHARAGVSSGGAEVTLLFSHAP